MAFGFIGLGNIGRPMARRLAEAAAGTWVYDVDPAACAALADIARVATSLPELSQACSLIAVCVRNDDDVRDVVQGLLPSIRQSGAVIAVHSTISLETLMSLAQAAASRGAELIDAAVTGGAESAAKGALTAMIGGSEGIVERARPLLAPYASNIIHAGALGAGMKLKVANNLVTYTQLAIGVEATRLAKLSGVDPAQLMAVMSANGNLTPAMGIYLQARADGAAKGEFEKLLAFQKWLAELAEKDLDHALGTARAAGVPTPIGEHVRALFRPTVERIDT